MPIAALVVLLGLALARPSPARAAGAPPLASPQAGPLQVLPPTGEIVAYLFADLNGDGRRDGDEAGLSGWQVQLFTGEGCSGDSVRAAITNEQGTVTFSDLRPGRYWVREALQDGWLNTTALCQELPVSAGEMAEVQFGNLPLAVLTIVKLVEGEDGERLESPVEGVLVGPAPPQDVRRNGRVVFLLLPGTYTVTEHPKPGRALSVTCTSGESGDVSVRVELAPGESVTCTFVEAPAPRPAIGLEVSASPQAGDAPLRVTYLVSVVNTGNVELSDVAVESEGLGLRGAACGSGTLRPGESCLVQAAGSYAAAGTFVSAFVACGAYGGERHCASATVSVRVSETAGIAITRLPETGGGPVARAGERDGPPLTPVGLVSLAVALAIPLCRLLLSLGRR